MLIDLHIHTNLSPCGHGQMTIEGILNRAKARGLDGVCITDHDTMAIRHAIREGVQANGVHLFFGMEYSTDQGDFLVFGPFETLPAGLPAELLLQTVDAWGGIAIAAHPFRRVRPTNERLLRQKLCRAVECLNGRNDRAENRAVGAWLARYAPTECGGSDAHTLDEVGTYATRFLTPVRSRTDLVRALANRMCRPEIVNPGVAASPRGAGLDLPLGIPAPI